MNGRAGATDERQLREAMQPSDCSILCECDCCERLKWRVDVLRAAVARERERGDKWFRHWLAKSPLQKYPQVRHLLGDPPADAATDWLDLLRRTRRRRRAIRVREED